jgi:D-glycero-D-manno-heptose 1,7-bisphosphate phosphatase
MKKAVFFERDGILNPVEIVRGQPVIPKSLAEFHVNTAVRPLLARLREAGFALIATSNQPGVSRGYLPRRELDLMHTVLRRALPLDAVYVCPHDELDDCTCHKPEAGLLIEAGYEHQVSLEHSYVVSDKWQDAKAAEQVGATSLLLRSPWNGTCHHDFILPTLEAITEKILTLVQRRQFAAG